MSQTSWEEAKLCPKCERPGEDRKQTPGEGTSKIHHIFCVTKLCPWFGTPWFVQVNADGSIPPKQDPSTFQKQYPKLSAETETRITEGIERQLKAETERQTPEIRNPHSR